MRQNDFYIMYFDVMYFILMTNIVDISRQVLITLCRTSKAGEKGLLVNLSFGGNPGGGVGMLLLSVLLDRRSGDAQILVDGLIY